MISKRWLAFAGGASAALIASRLLPPVLSQGLAVYDRQRGHDPFDVLAKDHARFRQLLADMDQGRGRSLAWRGQMFLRLKRGLGAHALAEEDVVYPLLREEAGADAAARQLNEEHGQMKADLYALERCLDNEDRWLARVRALRSLVERHARQEEEVEFPRLRRLLDEESLQRLGRHVHREKSMLL